ncbi:uncharacterized protein LOC131243681 isoform X3 [Magnolia sinica]|uniref:uncharacterized protein LOC131243681 isoform X3 n=1 Tax=Magnolia sinica TaxID=86752 RepID=UPI002658AEC4|nr:uncharacterized protein LOC131243681 isoform X3 [Magnolia sinica]
MFSLQAGMLSSEEIHSSRVKYLLKRGKPYIWIQEDDLHNVNTILDERGSLSVTNIMPGPLMSLLRSIKKLPARVALVGDVVPLKDEKVKSAAEILRETILSERNAVSRASYSVSGILSSSSISCNSRSENLQEVLEESDTYGIYKFNIRMHLWSRWTGKDLMSLARSLVRSTKTVSVSTNGRSSDSLSKKRPVTSKPSAGNWLKWKRRLSRMSPVTVAWGWFESHNQLSQAAATDLAARGV